MTELIHCTIGGHYNLRHNTNNKETAWPNNQHWTPLPTNWQPTPYQ